MVCFLSASCYIVYLVLLNVVCFFSVGVSLCSECD